MGSVGVVIDNQCQNGEDEMYSKLQSLHCSVSIFPYIANYMDWIRRVNVPTEHHIHHRPYTAPQLQ